MKTIIHVVCMVFAIIGVAECADEDKKCMGIQTITGKGNNKSPIIPPLSEDCFKKLDNNGISLSLPFCPKDVCDTTYKAPTTIKYQNKNCNVICPHIFHYAQVVCDTNETCGTNKHCDVDENFKKTYTVLANCPGKPKPIKIKVENVPYCCSCQND
ncbi:uncharacterized protein LOC106180581 [Lingula anatina]|uniref:Uncharacterized protein LOC106180581 n=1 Tax=Lingula anatina TaxID=7574 RepID=A0A1S3KCS4_LINAN|nr:uncharacterized protein LOC106180581 [Lingula anatina]|eukprot:XP_013420056.1 uncharacterized protein LOC106180581 [Lingula anatina]